MVATAALRCRLMVTETGSRVAGRVWPLPARDGPRRRAQARIDKTEMPRPSFYLGRAGIGKAILARAFRCAGSCANEQSGPFGQTAGGHGGLYHVGTLGAAG